MQQFAPLYLELFKQTDALISNGDSNPVLQSVLLSHVKIFYFLSFQDLPAFFEDHLTEFMTLLHKYISVGQGFEEVKENICDSINLYLMKYEEEFTMLPTFIESIWNLLMSLTLDSKYDRVRHLHSFNFCWLDMQFKYLQVSVNIQDTFNC
jgi:exportin-2 (importin alpha re-exporter)